MTGSGRRTKPISWAGLSFSNAAITLAWSRGSTRDQRVYGSAHDVFHVSGPLGCPPQLRVDAARVRYLSAEAGEGSGGTEGVDVFGDALRRCAAADEQACLDVFANAGLGDVSAGDK
jgi:hypothetical protein